MAELDPRDSPRGVEAARRVMLELWSILGEYAGAMTLVGGSAPPLLVGDVPDDPYVGTLDVDVVIDPLAVPDQTYRSIAAQLRGRGYQQAGQPFQWLRTVVVEEEGIIVEVDLLAPATARFGRSHRHERIEGEPVSAYRRLRLGSREADEVQALAFARVQRLLEVARHQPK